MSKTYTFGIVGGTFDHFHAGHKTLLGAAFEQAKYVTVGIGTEAIYKHKVLAHTIEPYAIRKQTVQAFLNAQQYTNRGTVIPIDTIYGTTLIEKNIEAIFATEENMRNVDKVNQKRKEIGFPELVAITVPYVKNEDGTKISSERIRKGEIARNGHVYDLIFAKKSQLLLPEALRENMRKPLGKVVKDLEALKKELTDKPLIIAVGDIIAQSLIDAKIPADISIIDFKTRRQPLKISNIKYQISNINPAGTIQSSAVKAYQKLLQEFFRTRKPQTLIINGEEDLLALPAMLLAPLQSVVLYGQFEAGIVVNEVTEERKKEIDTILAKFV